MKRMILSVVAVLVAMSVSAHAGYNPARAEAFKPAVVKASSASSGSSYKSGGYKSKGKSSGSKSGSYKAAAYKK